jgi:hypothetical protein
LIAVIAFIYLHTSVLCLASLFFSGAASLATQVSREKFNFH